MYSSENLERFYFQYQTEALPEAFFGEKTEDFPDIFTGMKLPQDEGKDSACILALQ